MNRVTTKGYPPLAVRICRQQRLPPFFWVDGLTPLFGSTKARTPTNPVWLVPVMLPLLLLGLDAAGLVPAEVHCQPRRSSNLAMDATGLVPVVLHLQPRPLSTWVWQMVAPMEGSILVERNAREAGDMERHACGEPAAAGLNHPTQGPKGLGAVDCPPKRSDPAHERTMNPLRFAQGMKLSPSGSGEEIGVSKKRAGSGWITMAPSLARKVAIWSCVPTEIARHSRLGLPMSCPKA